MLLLRASCPASTNWPPISRQAASTRSLRQQWEAGGEAGQGRRQLFSWQQWEAAAVWLAAMGRAGWLASWLASWLAGKQAAAQRCNQLDAGTAPLPAPQAGQQCTHLSGGPPRASIT